MTVTLVHSLILCVFCSQERDCFVYNQMNESRIAKSCFQGQILEYKMKIKGYHWNIILYSHFLWISWILIKWTMYNLSWTSSCFTGLSQGSNWRKINLFLDPWRPGILRGSIIMIANWHWFMDCFLFFFYAQYAHCHICLYGIYALL